MSRFQLTAYSPQALGYEYAKYIYTYTSYIPSHLMHCIKYPAIYLRTRLPYVCMDISTSLTLSYLASNFWIFMHSLAPDAFVTIKLNQRFDRRNSNNVFE